MTDWMKSLWALLGLVTLAVSTPARAADDKKGLPEGWFVTESSPQLYESGLDAQGPCEGQRSAWLRSTQETPTGYGTFMQAFGAQSFRGKRLRFSAVVRTEDIKGWAGLWMRVEGEDPKEPLAFDNMQSRALKGTTPCTRYDVVLDVPPEAKAIMAGLMLSGTGKAWVGAVHIEPVDTSTPTTNLIADRTPQRQAAQELEEMPGPSNDPVNQTPLRQGVGRVGRFWFTAEKADTYRGRYVHQPDGTWKNEVLDNVLTVEHGPNGDTVKGQLNNRPLHVTVRSGGITRIQGTWGVDRVSIELDGHHLTLDRGVEHRELVPEGSLREDGTCLRYLSRQPVLVSDYVDLCGLTLNKTPPAVPLVVAFLSDGFRSVADRLQRLPR